MNILVWSPTLGWNSTNFSPHYYLFKTQYQHYGKYPNDINWLKFYDISIEEAIDNLDTAPGAVFLGVYPWNKKSLYDFIELLGNKFPSTPVFLGGVELNFHDTSAFNDLPNVRGLIKGEGEVPITLIINAVVEQSTFNDIPGLWLRNDITKGYTKPRLESPKIKYKDGIGPKSDEFFEVDYSWIIEHEKDILADIEYNHQLNLKRNLGYDQKYFFWESSRGCPYGCVYCDWGGGINTKVRRKPQWMIEQELEIIFKNLDENLFFHLVDANFGIFTQDIDTAQCIADLIRKYNKIGKVDIVALFAKNNADNVLKIMEILNPVKSELPWNLDIQSTDQGVLDDIKRTQMPMPEMSAKFKIKEKKSKFFTSVMLGLPGSNFEKEFKSWCDIRDEGSEVNANLTSIPPQAPMYTPEFIKEWDVKTFKTSYEHATINHLNYATVQESAETIYMHSCKSFSTEEYINILMMFDVIQFIDGCYITKFARLLANRNGYGTYDFYKPIVDKFLNDKNWLGNVDTYRDSIRAWIFDNQPYGYVNGKVFIDRLMKNLIVKYYYKDLKQDLLDIVGHMHKDMGDALDIGFRSLPVNSEEIFYLKSNLKYVTSPACELVETDKENTIQITPKIIFDDSVKDVARRVMLPSLIDDVVSNYLP